jgi:Myb-like DNA-binding domain
MAHQLPPTATASLRMDADALVRLVSTPRVAAAVWGTRASRAAIEDAFIDAHGSGGNVALAKVAAHAVVGAAGALVRAFDRYSERGDKGKHAGFPLAEMSAALALVHPFRVAKEVKRSLAALAVYAALYCFLEEAKGAEDDIEELVEKIKKKAKRNGCKMSRRDIKRERRCAITSVLQQIRRSSFAFLEDGGPGDRKPASRKPHVDESSCDDESDSDHDIDADDVVDGHRQNGRRLLNECLKILKAAFAADKAAKGIRKVARVLRSLQSEERTLSDIVDSVRRTTALLSVKVGPPSMPAVYAAAEDSLAPLNRASLSRPVSVVAGKKSSSRKRAHVHISEGQESEEEGPSRKRRASANQEKNDSEDGEMLDSAGVKNGEVDGDVDIPSTPNEGKFPPDSKDRAAESIMRGNDKNTTGRTSTPVGQVDAPSSDASESSADDDRKQDLVKDLSMNDLNQYAADEFSGSDDDDDDIDDDESNATLRKAEQGLDKPMSRYGPQDKGRSVSPMPSDDDDYEAGQSRRKRIVMRKRGNLDVRLSPVKTKESAAANGKKRTNRFTASDDEQLVKGLERYGWGEWSLIASHYEWDHPRTNVSLKDRARTLNLNQRNFPPPLNPSNEAITRRGRPSKNAFEYVSRAPEDEIQDPDENSAPSSGIED